MLHLMPSAIMFLFTVAFASLFLIPVTSYTPKNLVAGFYWNGVWAFLSAICAVAGADQTLMLLKYPARGAGELALQILLITFILFVVFGWFRLMGTAALHGLQRVLAKVRS